MINLTHSISQTRHIRIPSSIYNLELVVAVQYAKQNAQIDINVQ